MLKLIQLTFLSLFVVCATLLSTSSAQLDPAKAKAQVWELTWSAEEATLTSFDRSGSAPSSPWRVERPLTAISQFDSNPLLSELALFNSQDFQSKRLGHFSNYYHSGLAPPVDLQVLL